MRRTTENNDHNFVFLFPHCCVCVAANFQTQEQCKYAKNEIKASSSIQQHQGTRDCVVVCSGGGGGGDVARRFFPSKTFAFTISASISN